MLDNTTQKFDIFLHKNAHFPKSGGKCARKVKEKLAKVAQFRLHAHIHPLHFVKSACGRSKYLEFFIYLPYFGGRFFAFSREKLNFNH